MLRRVTNSEMPQATTRAMAAMPPQVLEVAGELAVQCRHFRAHHSRVDGSARTALRRTSTMRPLRMRITLSAMEPMAALCVIRAVVVPRLWQSDGTAEGTKLIRDLSPETYSSLQMVKAGPRLFFPAWEEEIGWELWAMRE